MSKEFESWRYHWDDDDIVVAPRPVEDAWNPDQPRGPDGKWSPEGGGGGGSGAPAQSLDELEKLATKFGSAKVVINGEELEISRQVKSTHRRYNYRHGGRHLGRDQVEKLFLTGDETLIAAKEANSSGIIHRSDLEPIHNKKNDSGEDL